MAINEFEARILANPTANGSIAPLSEEFAKTVVSANLVQTSSGPKCELTFTDGSRRMVSYDYYGRADRKRIPVASLRWKTTVGGYTCLTAV